jgi:excisionase family DNA binding protein
MDTYLTIHEAAKVMQVSEDALNKLALSGKIRSIMATGTLLVNSRDLRTNPGITAQPEYNQFIHLAGVEISMSEAERRYGVLQSTISRWVRDGLIAKIGKHGLQVMIDEAQIATAATIYKNSGGGHGTWIFRKGQLHNAKPKCD